MKAILAALVITVLSSCVVGRWVFNVPGGKYVTTLRMFE